MTNEVYVSNIVKPIVWEKVPSDRINSVSIKFSFSKEWEDLLCVAQFNQNGSCKNQLIENGKCKIPVEIGIGYVALTVFGTKENGESYRATTIPYVFEVYDSKFCSDGETPIPPTPDLYDQLIAKFLEQVTFPPFDNDFNLESENALQNKILSSWVEAATKEISKKLSKDETDLIEQDGKVQITSEGNKIGDGFELPKVDDRLNEESLNAVQNKVVTEFLNKILRNEIFIHNSSGGFRAGRDGLVNSGAALGDNSETNDGVSIGANTFSIDGIAAGKNAIANGKNAISIGADSSAQGNSIQIGSGSNIKDNTVQFYEFQILDENGKIPLDRLTVDSELKDSQNPVANSAVFNEFSKIKNLELWNDIKLSNDANSVSMTQTDSGNPLNIKKLFLIFTGKTDVASPALRFHFNNTYIYQMAKLFSTNSADDTFTVWMYSEKIAPGVFKSVYSNKALTVSDIDFIQGLSNANSDLGGCIYHSSYTNDIYRKATNWSFGLLNQKYNLKAGSRILVWGQQDD